LTSCALASAEKVEEQTVEVRPGTAVRIENRNGRVRVVPGRPGQVKIRAVKKARATSNPSALLDRIHVTVEKKAGQLTIKGDHPTGGIARQYKVGFHVEVPPDTRLTAETRNGNVRVKGLTAGLSIATRNGNVRAVEVSGHATLSTRNGNVLLNGKVGQFTLVTRNGNVRIELRGGTRLTGASRVETRNGNVTLTAPPTLSAAFRARTRNGRIRSDFPLAESSRTKASGKIGAGQAGLTLETRNGNIRIHKL
jgi:hypothetical protein